MNAKAFSQCAPLVVLGLALGALIFHAVPEGNKDVVIAIVSGLLGYLTKEAQQFIANATDSSVAVSTPVPPAPDSQPGEPQ